MFKKVVYLDSAEPARGRATIRRMTHGPARLLVMLALVALMSAGCDSTVARTPRASTWNGVVSHVSDGDTLWVRPAGGGAPRKIRLDGIDAPEICQKGGPAARAALASKLSGRAVAVRTRRLDTYRRELATISVGGEDIGAWMVTSGQAWSYRWRRDAGPYQSQEQAARRARRGLFADSRPQNPREFRKRHGPCDKY